MSDWTTHFSAEQRTGKAPVENRSFAGCDLSGAQLANAKFRNCNFANAVLRDAALDGAQLVGCDLSGVDASGCEATGASFVDVTWRAGRATGADFGKSEFSNVDLSDTDLTRAMLRGADLSRSNLQRSKLVEADLRRLARFSSCDLRGANFDGALLGPTVLDHCALHGITGSPRDPYDVEVIDGDLSPNADGSQLAGWDAIAHIWRSQRAPQSSPFALGPRASDSELESVVVTQMIDAKPELDALFDAPAPLFPVLVPWFRTVRIFAVSAAKARPQRIVCAAVFPGLATELLEGSPESLTRAAAAEPVRIRNADDALAYARFGYYVTRGAAAAAIWTGQERVEQAAIGWIVHVSTEIAGKTISNRITVSSDGAFRCDEDVVA